jgi:glycosyltransferase involved in cell wall biosynthesis
MIDKHSPKMSVIILAPDCYQTICKTMSCLRAQTVRDQLEIIIVRLSASTSPDGELDLTNFNNVRVIEIGPMNSTAKARAVGVRYAAAPVVAFAEDHSYPDPHWAEALIRTHQGSWAAVGPAICNANPTNTLSWTNLAIEYGPWLHPVTGGSVDHLPGHNSSYKRDLLLAYGPQLEAMLEAESILHWDLRNKGHQLYLEPAAKTFHLNYSSPIATLRLRFLGGRLFAAARARHWSALRRLLYGGGAVLIPLLRLRRVSRDLRRAVRLRHSVRARSMLTVALALDTAGEMTGYLFGGGQTMRTLSDMEFHRIRYLSEDDRQRLASES